MTTAQTDGADVEIVPCHLGAAIANMQYPGIIGAIQSGLSCRAPQSSPSTVVRVNLFTAREAGRYIQRGPKKWGKRTFLLLSLKRLNQIV